MDTLTRDRIRDLVTAAVTTRSAPNVSEAVLADATLEDLTSGTGMDTSADAHAARRSGNPIDAEAARQRELSRARAVARRAAQRRKAARRAGEQADRDAQTVTPEALRAVMPITTLLVGIIDTIATSRARRVERMVGTAAEDACSETFIAVNREIALCEHDHAALALAAAWLSAQVGVPDCDGDSPEHASWLMGVIVNRSRSSVQRIYRDMYAAGELRSDSLERLDTALANSGGVDTVIARHLADRVPGMTGARFPTPGRPDAHLLSATLAAAITARGLDALVEVLLDDAHRRSDGYFRWTEFSRDVFAACGMAESYDSYLADRDPAIRAEYAKRLAQRTLRWLRIATVMAHDHFERGAFDPDTFLADGSRVLASQTYTLAVFPDPEAAAAAIADALDALTL